MNRGKRTLERFAKYGIENYLYTNYTSNRPIESELVAAIESGNLDILSEYQAELPYTLSGDYVNGLVEKSNRLALKELGIVTTRYLGFGAEVAVVTLDDLISSMNPNHSDNSLWDNLQSLADYPLLDDDIHCELEHDVMLEQWESWGQSDLMGAIERQLDRPDESDDNYELEPISLDDIASVVWNYSHAEGESWYFDTKRIAKEIIATMPNLIKWRVVE